MTQGFQPNRDQQVDRQAVRRDHADRRTVAAVGGYRTLEPSPGGAHLWTKIDHLAQSDL